MTVIAWDGTTLASDKRAVQAGCCYPVTKIHRVDRDRLLGMAGNLSRGMLVLAWLRDGKPLADWPEQKGDDDWVTCLVVHRRGALHRYESRGTPFAVEAMRHAIGSGRDFAVAGMALGLNAEAAVRLACDHSAECGNGIDTLTFEAP